MCLVPKGLRSPEHFARAEGDEFAGLDLFYGALLDLAHPLAGDSKRNTESL
jgi:hypothetical protein